MDADQHNRLKLIKCSNLVHEDESMDWADIDPNLLEELDVIRKKNLGKMVDHIDPFANIASPEYVAERYEHNFWTRIFHGWALDTVEGDI